MEVAGKPFFDCDHALVKMRYQMDSTIWGFHPEEDLPCPCLFALVPKVFQSGAASASKFSPCAGRFGAAYVFLCSYKEHWFATLPALY